MKKVLVFLLMLTGFNGFSQTVEQQHEKKTPELKLATDPKEGSNEKKPELKLVDHSNANEEKVKKANTGTPELKLISR